MKGWKYEPLMVSIFEVLKDRIFEDLIVLMFEWFQGGSDWSWRVRRIEGELDPAVLSWNFEISVLFKDGLLNFCFLVEGGNKKMQISVLQLRKNEIEGFLVLLGRDMGKMNWRKVDFWIYGLINYGIVLSLGAGIIILKMMCLSDLRLFFKVLVLFCEMDGMRQEQKYFDVGKQKMGRNQWVFPIGLFYAFSNIP